VRGDAEVKGHRVDRALGLQWSVGLRGKAHDLQELLLNRRDLLFELRVESGCNVTSVAVDGSPPSLNGGPDHDGQALPLDCFHVRVAVGDGVAVASHVTNAFGETAAHLVRFADVGDA